mgnify:FL=1
MASPVPRTDFPTLARPARGGNRLVYLDSGATSLKPRAVLDAVEEMSVAKNGAVKRGSHLLAEEASAAFEDARDKVARFVGADPGELVWTSGTTQSINLLAYAMSNVSAGRGPSVGASALQGRLSAGPGDSVVVTRAEHHANLVPWQELCRRTGAELRWLDCDSDGRIDLETLSVIDGSTKLVAFAHVSNVTGAVAPVEAVVAAAREAGALTVLDACQSVPHMPVDLKALDVDFAAFSGHKMLGPTGVGALYGRRELLEAMPPYQFGGSMIEVVEMDGATYAQPPERFEAGTQPVAEAVGMGAAAEYLAAAGMGRVAAHEKKLTERMLAGMADIAGVRVLGPREAVGRTGAVAFSVDGVHPHDVGQVLDADGVAVRTGHHCAQPIHRHFGVFASSRASLGPYNDEADVDAFLEALKKVRPFFGVEQG